MNRVTIVSDASATPPVTDSPNFGWTDVGYYLGANLGIISHIDFYGSVSPGGVPLVGIKLQLIGPTYQEEKAKGFSLAITAAAGYSKDNSNNGVIWAYNRKAWSEDASLVFGFRANKFTLLYGWPFLSLYQVNGSITQSRGSTSNYPFSGKGSQRGINLGVEVGRTTFFRVKGALVEGKYNSAKRVMLDAGAIAGLRW